MNNKLKSILEIIKVIVVLGLFPIIIYLVGTKSISMALAILAVLVELGIMGIINSIERIKNEIKLKEYFQVFGMQNK